MRRGAVWLGGLLLLAAWLHAAPPLGTESIRRLRAAADAGDAQAQFLLGKQYQVGDGVERDPTAAAQWYRRSAEAGSAEAQNALGSLIRSGEVDSSTPDEAEKWFRAAAAQGSAEAQFNLGRLYEADRAARQDAAEAARWYAAAAQGGSAEAWKRLGDLHANGKGLPVNLAEALRCYREGAQRGDVSARFILDRREAVLAGAKADRAAAEREWREAAAKGDIGARLAFWELEHPSAPLETAEETVRWSLLLSGLRGADAWVVRGYILENGVGAARDFPEAAKAYRQAADLGSALAQASLARLYATGRGVPRDPVEAYAWLAAARANGFSDLDAEIEQAGAGLNPGQKAAAEQLAKQRTAHANRR